MKWKTFEAACTLIAAVIWSCPGDLAGAGDSTDKINYAEHVVPILESACLSCHNPDKAKGGLDLTSYAGTMAGGSGGQVVQPGNPDRSRLYTLAAHLEEPNMPPNKPKIEQAKLDILKRWIDDGLLESKGSKAKKASGPTLTAAVETTGERPKEPAMPKHLLLEPAVLTERGTAITALASSPWAPLVAVGGQKQVVLYHTETLELVGILPFPEGGPDTLSFSRNGDLLLAGGGRAGKSGKAVAWDVKTGQRVFEVGREFDAALAADISPDHKLVALGGPGRNIKVYDAQTGDPVRSIKKHPDWLLKLKFSPDGVLFASGGRNGEIFVWESQTGIEFYELPDHQKAITGLSWRADSNVLAACSEDGNVTLWEMQNGKQMKKWAAHPGGALAIQFSPDGSKLVTGGRDKAVKIWDLNGALKREIKGFPDLVTAVVFTQDGKKIVSGNWQGELKVWDASTGSELGSLLSNPPCLEVQLSLAEQRVSELEAKMPGLESAATSSATALAEAVKRRDASASALAQTKKEHADAGKMATRGDQLLAEATGKTKAAVQAQQTARKALDDARGAAEKSRVQLEAAKARLAEVDRKLTPLVQEHATLETQLAEATARSQKAVQERDAARKSLQEILSKPELLKGQPGMDAKLRKVVDESNAAYLQANAVIKELTGKRAALVRAKDTLAQSREETRRGLKAIELVVSQQPPAIQEAERQLPEAESRLAGARKFEQENKSRVEEVKKLLAGCTELLKQREEAAKAAGLAVTQTQAKEAAAKDALGKAKQDLAFARYLVEKFRAAKVNLQLNSENELLTKCRDEYAQIQNRAKAAVEAHETAAQALAAAQQAFQEARKTVQKSNEVVELAKDQVVKTGLNVMAAGLVEGMDGKQPGFRKELESTSSRVKQSLADLAQASKTAKEGPGLIEERARQRAAKEAEMKRALDQLKAEEKKVAEKAQSVEQLRKRYEELYREWKPETAVASK